MIEGVIDASVLLAILKNEAIDESAQSLVSRGVMSTVNVAEIYTKVAVLELPSTPFVDAMVGSLLEIHAFTIAHSRVAGFLRSGTRHAGLSLGDRACLALALELGLPAYTVDRNWLRVDVGCPIHCLR